MSRLLVAQVLPADETVSRDVPISDNNWRSLRIGTNYYKPTSKDGICNSSNLSETSRVICLSTVAVLQGSGSGRHTSKR